MKHCNNQYNIIYHFLMNNLRIQQLRCELRVGVRVLSARNEHSLCVHSLELLFPATIASAPQPTMRARLLSLQSLQNSLMFTSSSLLLGDNVITFCNIFCQGVVGFAAVAVAANRR